MVHAAAKTGCEAIKHQTHFLDDEMTEDAKKIVPPNADKSIWEIMKKCCLTKDQEIKLKEFTENLGMIYISTPFSRRAADFLAEIEIPAFKIGSGECDNLLFVEHIASIGKPIILSTGMASDNEVSNIINSIINKKRNNISVLHAVWSFSIESATSKLARAKPSPSPPAPANISTTGKLIFC